MSGPENRATEPNNPFGANMTTTNAEKLYARFETSEGTIVCELFAKEAPVTVKNFVELAK